MKLKINRDLEESILKDVPPNYSELEKALFIYQQLCLKTEYALDYYLDEDRVKDEYTKVANLPMVDGKENKDVVCFTFNAIYLKLLIDAGVIDEQDANLSDIMDKNRLSAFHQELKLVIGGHKYEIDSTSGVLDNNDLALLKYSCNKITGFDCIDSDLGLDDEVGNKLLEAAIKKVQEQTLNLSSLSKKYVELKEREDTLKNLPLSERVEMFLDIVKESSLDYSLKSFTHMLKIKQVLFTEQELGKKGIVKNIDFVFVKDHKNNDELKAFLFFNNEGYVDDLGYENFSALRVFEISLKEQQTKEVEAEDVRERCQRGELLPRDNKAKINDQKKQSPMKMLNDGKVTLTKAYDGKPQFDEKQQPLNLSHYVRTHILTGEKETLSIEEVRAKGWE